MFQTLIPNPELLCIVCYFLSKGEPCRHLIGQLHGSSETGQPPLPAAPIVIQPPKPKKNLWSITTALKSHYRYLPNYVLVCVEMMSDYRKLEPCLNTVVNVVRNSKRCQFAENIFPTGSSRSQAVRRCHDVLRGERSSIRSWSCQK